MRTPPEWVFHVLTWSLAAIGLITIASMIHWPELNERLPHRTVLRTVFDRITKPGETPKLRLAGQAFVSRPRGRCVRGEALSCL
jgi:hypothetical protein